ncbi:MAG: spore protease YyaC [Firmicutes bacterium]|nr:spore protease YyaC [Bacillota bacterium]
MLSFVGGSAVTYIDTGGEGAAEELYWALRGFVTPAASAGEGLVFLCIGSDRATGDCLGPITGHKLASAAASRGGETLAGRGFAVYGTLESPVHAKNIREALDGIRSRHGNPFIIAVDACLGRAERIGFLTVGSGAVVPGAGLNKRLPAVGDVFITGIVNCFSGVVDFAALQNTRLGLVMKMADVICEGIMRAVAGDS